MGALDSISEFLKNVSNAIKGYHEYTPKGDYSAVSIAILKTNWNKQIVDTMHEMAVQALNKYKVGKIDTFEVPGSFELSFAANFLANSKMYDAIICFGAIIKGETKHDEYIANAIANGITQASMQHNVPIIFGVLTTNNSEQAYARIEKGNEAALAALQMIDFTNNVHKAK